MAMTENRPAAAAVFDQDVGEPAFRAADTKQVRLDSAFAEIFLVQLAVVVRAGRSHIPAAQSPKRGGDDGGGDLTAESNLSVHGVGLAVSGGEVLEAQHNVGGVFADAGEVHEGNGHEGEAYLNSLKKQKAGAEPASYNFSFPWAVVNRVFYDCNSLQNETLRPAKSAAGITEGAAGVEGWFLRRSCARTDCVISARKSFVKPARQVAQQGSVW